MTAAVTCIRALGLLWALGQAGQATAAPVMPETPQPISLPLPLPLRLGPLSAHELPPPPAGGTPEPPMLPHLGVQARQRAALAAANSVSPAAGLMAAAVTAPGMRVSDDGVLRRAEVGLAQHLQIGLRRLVNINSYGSLALGPNLIGSNLFALATPQMAIYGDDGRWALALQVPLNLAAAGLVGRRLVYERFRVRGEDWQEPSNYLRGIRFLRFGLPEAKNQLSIASLWPYSLGYGSLVNRYQPSLDVNRSMTGADFSIGHEFIELHGLINDLTLSNRVMGASLALRPLLNKPAPAPMRSLRLSGEYVADLRAPRCVQHGPADTSCVAGSGQTGGLEPGAATLRDATFVRSDPKSGRYRSDSMIVQAVALWLESTLSGTDASSLVQLYAGWQHFLNSGGGSGSALGLRGSLVGGDSWLSALRWRGEIRLYGDGFRPSYFDTTYETNKYEFGLGANPYQANPTKAQAVFGDPAHGFVRGNLGQRQGARIDLEWALYHGHRSQRRLALGAGFEISTGPNDSTAYLQLEAPLHRRFQLFATYMHINAARAADLLNLRGRSLTDTVLLAGLRLQMAPFMWLSVNASNTPQTSQSPGSEYHLGNARVAGQGPVLPTSRLFSNYPVVTVELEFGWEVMR